MSALNVFLIILIIALAAALLFFVIPAVLIFFAVFYRKTPVPFEEYNLKKYKNHYFVPYAGRVGEARKVMRARAMTRAEVTAKDGVTLRGAYYDNGSKRTAILFHGINSEIYTNLSPQASFLYQQSFNVLLVWHRGHAESGGRWTTIGLREQYDVPLWVDWAKEHGADEVLLYGVSMGAATVAYASDKLDGGIVKGMVIDSGFYSVYEQMKRDQKRMHIPAVMLPAMSVMAKWFLKADIKETTADSLRNTRIPALFIHGERDETVEYKWSVKNYEACASEKDFILVKNAPHTLSIVENPKEVGKKLTAFINVYFK